MKSQGVIRQVRGFLATMLDETGSDSASGVLHDAWIDIEVQPLTEVRGRRLEVG